MSGIADFEDQVLGEDVALMKKEIPMLRKKYDFAFSLGSACSATQALRQAGLQYASFPFDWLYGSTLVGRAQLIAEDFKDWIRKDALVAIKPPDDHKTDIWENVETGIVFNHDFPRNVPLSESFAGVEEKYRRRISRFLNQIERSKRILVFFLATPIDTLTEDADLLKTVEILKHRFPGKEFHLLYGHHLPGVSYAQRQTRELSPEVTSVGYDYKKRGKLLYPYAVEADESCKILASISVKDYRSAKERRTFRVLKRQRRYAKYGATCFLGYVVARIASHMRKHLLRTERS